MPRATAPIKVAIVGYGPHFNMGRFHAELIDSVEGLEVAAVCDLDRRRLRAARREIGDHVKTYTDVRRLAKDQDVQLAAVVLPHDAHCPVALTLLRAGKHVVVEKPMALTVRQCDRMIETARKAGVSLSVFHNRRYDGEFLAIKDVIEQGYVGEVFHLETHHGDYARPREWWRSDKAVSGGTFYDWGAHYVDWVLNLMPGKMTSVSGQFQERVWKHVTNEDHCEAYVKFDSGAAAHVQISTTAAAPKPRWYILGTKGAIVDCADGHLTVYSRTGEHTASFEVEYQEGQWGRYYEMFARHLLEDGPNPVTPESARRVIALIGLAERSWRTGKEQKVPYEQ